MTYSLAAFSEPRGVMRILQFIFAICAFATTANFVSTVTMTCESKTDSYEFSYPFSLDKGVCFDITANQTHMISADLSSDSQFFVATGVLSMLYCIFIIAVYAMFDELYRSKNEIPLADFMLTTILAIFWLSGSAAWSNGTNAFKTVTDSALLNAKCAPCTVITASFSRLNISLILGFLNFFLWASDLWFLYKETIWFQGRRASSPAGGGSSLPSV